MMRDGNLILRPIKESDIEEFLRWFNDPEITQYLTVFLPMTEGWEKKWLADIENNPEKKINFVMEVKQYYRTKIIGEVGLIIANTKDRDAEFGIVIGDTSFHSSGYGTRAAILLINYAFDQLDLARISSAAVEFNEKSIKLHEKLGFKEEGRIRKSVYRNGRRWDKLLFGLLREEWKPEEIKLRLGR